MRIRTFLCMLLSSAGLMAQSTLEPGQQIGVTGAPVAPKEAPAAKGMNPKLGEMLKQFDWLQGDKAAFEKLIADAAAAGAEEIDLLIPRVECALLFGEPDNLARALANAESRRKDLLLRKPNDAEEIKVTLKLAKQYLDLAAKRPKEAPRRAEIFRNYLYALDTVENARILDTALEQIVAEKKLAAGVDVKWEDLRENLQRDTRLYTNATTVLGDKFGPFQAGRPILIPAATYEKLKDYLPPEQWSSYVPKQ